MLALYRQALQLRHELPALGAGSGGDVAWLDLRDDVVAFRREPGFTCVVNTGSVPAALPDGDVLLASGPVTDGKLPADTAAWLIR